MESGARSPAARPGAASLAGGVLVGLWLSLLGCLAGGSSHAAPAEKSVTGPPARAIGSSDIHQRDFGPLTIAYSIHPSYARVHVTLALGGVGVGEAILTPEAPAYEFRVSAGEAHARGALRYAPAAPPLMSSLEAELTELAPKTAETPFRGAIAAWIAAEDLIFHEIPFTLSPELFARTQVRGWSRSNAVVNLYAGSVLLTSVATTQGSPVARLDQPIRFGDALVEAGATFTLTVPTAAQRGQMFLQATYQSGNTPSTSISSAIAVWP